MKTLDTAIDEAVTTSIDGTPSVDGLQISRHFLDYMRFALPAETEFAIGHYGDYDHVRTENVANDAGGLTKFGVDQTSHPGVDIANLTLKQALVIYYKGDWTRSGAETMPPGYGPVLCDIHVNGGNGPVMLQEALNTLGAGLHVDGQLGHASHAAMVKYGDAGVRAFIARRDVRYDYLGEHGKAKFLQGWLDRDRNLLAALGLAHPAQSAQALA
jgi:lysozyme family protein